MVVAVVVAVALLLTRNILLWQIQHILLQLDPAVLRLLQEQPELTVEATHEMAQAATACLAHWWQLVAEQAVNVAMPLAD
jgi:hypothetical protein